MRDQGEKGHPIKSYFATAVHRALTDELDIHESEVEEYLTDMLVTFLRVDSVYAVRDREGRAVTSVCEMMLEGDVRFHADSFDREREVHRHIGDFLLFWSGLFPEFLPTLRSPGSKDALLDPIRQGRLSYHVASTFEHAPYGDEARVLRKLSNDFEAYQHSLGLVRASFEGFRRQGWPDGFSA
jgi:hypothetical protein